MKILLIVLLFSAWGAGAQDLNNTSWIKIKVERKDGSRIVGMWGLDTAVIKYVFEEDTVVASMNGEYSIKDKYSVNSGRLIIGTEGVNYDIDSASQQLLILTERTNETQDDKINRWYFVNARFLPDYLPEKNKLMIVDDTIYCNSFITPLFKGDINRLLVDEFYPTGDSRPSVAGEFIISPKGMVDTVKITKKEGMTKGEAKRFISVLKSTSGSWILPITEKDYYFKVKFVCNFSYTSFFISKDQVSNLKYFLWISYRMISFGGINISFHTSEMNPAVSMHPTFSELESADNHFNRGMKLAGEEDYQKAILQFSKCIAIDSFYLDAYYNEAYSFFKLNDKIGACRVWNQLKEMGQKGGEALYNKNCN